MLVLLLFTATAGRTCFDCGTGFNTQLNGKHGGTGMSLIHADTLYGGYVVSSVALWGKSSDTLVFDNLPAGASVKSAFLIWSIISSTRDSSMLLDGVQVPSVWAGTSPTPCRAGNGDSTFTYYADVGAFITDTGRYLLSGFHPTSTEGASLVVIYTQATDSYKNVVIYSGSYTLTGGTYGEYRWNIGGFLTQNPVGHARITYMFDDGQDYYGNACGIEYIFYDTSCVDSGPTTIPGSVGPYWDALEYDVSSITPPDTDTINVGYKTVVNGSGCTDCIGVAGLAFEVNTEPSVGVGEEPAPEDMMRTGPGWVFVMRPVSNASLKLYSPDGRLIKVLASGQLHQGRYEIGSVGSGVFIIRLESPSGSVSTKTVIR